MRLWSLVEPTLRVSFRPSSLALTAALLAVAAVLPLLPLTALLTTGIFVLGLSLAFMLWTLWFRTSAESRFSAAVLRESSYIQINRRSFSEGPLRVFISGPERETKRARQALSQWHFVEVLTQETGGLRKADLVVLVVGETPWTQTWWEIEEAVKLEKPIVALLSSRARVRNLPVIGSVDKLSHSYAFTTPEDFRVTVQTAVSRVLLDSFRERRGVPATRFS